MEDSNAYALIQEVIPNRNCIPFRERFAKLTLSSYKNGNIKPEIKQDNANDKNLETPSVSLIRKKLYMDDNNLPKNEELYTNNSGKKIMDNINAADGCSTHENSNDLVENMQMITSTCSQVLSDTSKIHGLRKNENLREEDSIVSISESSFGDNDKTKAKSLKIAFEKTTKSSSNTLTDKSLDRIANFLRDVSITNRNFLHKDRAGELPNVSEDMICEQDLLKAHLLAIADTESMNELVEESHLFLETSSNEHANIEKASTLVDTEVNNFTGSNSVISSRSSYNQSDNSNSWRACIDGDETESIIIDDSDESANIHPNKEYSFNENSTPSQKVIRDSNEYADNSSMSSIQKNSKQNINISAKINIQINISSEVPQYYDDLSLKITNGQSDTSKKRSSKKDKNIATLAKTNVKLHQLNCSNQAENVKKYKKNKEFLDCYSDKRNNVNIDDTNHLSESNISVNTFSSDAEKLLTELYGRSWQTPDIIHSIRNGIDVRKPKFNLSRKCLFGNINKNNEMNEKDLNRNCSNEEKLIDGSCVYQTHHHGTRLKIGRNVKKIDVDLSSEKKNMTSFTNAKSDHKVNTVHKSERNELKSTKIELPKARHQQIKNPNLILSQKNQEKAKIAADTLSNDRQSVRKARDTTKAKRKLFTPNYYNEGFNEEDDKSIELITHENNDENYILEDKYNNQINHGLLQIIYDDMVELKEIQSCHSSNSQVNSIPEVDTQSRVIARVTDKTQKLANCSKNSKTHIQTPDTKYSFLKSLDECVSKVYCHPEALHYRQNYKLKRDELTKVLYDLYNQRLFDNKLNVTIVWNKKLTNTAGRCINKKRAGIQTSVIELSDKVLSSADRLRCTLLHEMCHAATWIFNGEGGHGTTWKKWAQRANEIFPDIPKIGICHQYDIQYKYTYKCTTCGAKSHAHSKSKKVENVRCSYCYGSIEIFLNKITRDGNVVQTPVRQPSGFAKFVKDNYKNHKDKNLKHADIMKILSEEFAVIKLT